MLGAKYRLYSIQKRSGNYENNSKYTTSTTNSIIHSTTNHHVMRGSAIWWLYLVIEGISSMNIGSSLTKMFIPRIFRPQNRKFSVHDDDNQKTRYANSGNENIPFNPTISFPSSTRNRRNSRVLQVGQDRMVFS